MSHVAMANLICPICGSSSEAILLDRKLNPKAFEDHKTVNTPEICDRCVELLDKNYIALIGIDEEKSIIPDNGKITPKDFGNLYRTGEILWIKKEAAVHMFDYKKGFMIFVNDKIISEINKIKKIESIN